MAQSTEIQIRMLDIATAHTRLAKKWKNRQWGWSELADRCALTKRTSESVAEYRRMTREEQSRIKDVGGFVGGYLIGGKRKTGHVQTRSVVTLDIDHMMADDDLWGDFTDMFDCAAFMYSTHKHTAAEPRMRLVILPDRDMTPQEYEPVCRYFAAKLNINKFDSTTYQVARLFYWPSTPRDGEFYYRSQEGPGFSVDDVLATYRDWTDASEWPRGYDENDEVRRAVDKAEDPTQKGGAVGAFCRTYTIEAAIAKYLTDVYEPTASPGRYTYRAGHVSGGLVIYDGGKFAYANNETDPAWGRLCNAFDLVRIHLYGAEDKGRKDDDVTRRPSYRRMTDTVTRDDEVTVTLLNERRQSVAEDFVGLTESDSADGGIEGAADTDATKHTKRDTEWLKMLSRNKSGIEQSASNCVKILENDPALKGRLYYDEFRRIIRVDGRLPWPRAKNSDAWDNHDDANLRIYLDTLYGQTGKDRIADSLTAVCTRRSRHPVREYLRGLTWDGVERLDTLLIRYLGADDTELVRAQTRKQFTACVARVMRPGCKYDYCMILYGEQGVGKSTLLSVMGGEWFSDSVTTIEGKQAMEELGGKWIIEMGELVSMKRSEAEVAKAFFSRQIDKFRPAYGRVVENVPRQCVFFGTTNEEYFLKSNYGDRRMWPVHVCREHRTADLSVLKDERDQLWAEAVHRYNEGEQLYLSGALEEEARRRQWEVNDNSDDPVQGLLRAFVDRRVPADWSEWPLVRRRNYLRDPDPLDPAATVRRDVVSPTEFVCECLGIDPSAKEFSYRTRRAGAMFKEMGWEGPVAGSRHVERIYGRVRAYRRPKDNDDDPI